MLKNSSINGIKEGSKADLIVFERDRNMIKIIKTIKAGVVVHSCDN
jgi:imidazolonepropionase-like amidohydrolase